MSRRLWFPSLATGQLIAQVRDIFLGDLNFSIQPFANHLKHAELTVCRFTWKKTGQREVVYKSVLIVFGQFQKIAQVLSFSKLALQLYL